MLIGIFGAISKHESRKSFIIDNEEEAGYYFNTCGATNPRIARLGYTNNNADSRRPIYVVHASDLTYYTKTNTLIRRRIVQHSRMMTHKLMTAISRDYQILAVKTDCVIYEVKQDQKDYPVSKKCEFGGTRRERLSEEVKNQKYWPVQAPSVHTTVFDDTSREWKNPAGAVSETESFDYKRLLNLNRAYIEGAAGTGKSHILNKLSEHFESEGLKVTRCAYTHAAAALINGITSHSLFGINGATENDAFTQITSSIDVILIDELSMNPGSIYARLCNLPPHIKLFGFGDFRQHEPIEGRSTYKEHIKYKDTQMFRSLFDHNMITLRKNHRADKKHAEECISYHDFAEEHGVFRALSYAIPAGIRQTHEGREPLPKLNICYRNDTRRSINREVMEREIDEAHIVPIDQREPKSYDHREGCEYYIEHYDARKLMHLLNNRELYKEVFTNSSRKDGEDPYTLCAKYFANSWFTEDGLGHKRVEYFRCNDGRGRLIPDKSQSLSYITRPVRHIIANDYYIDIDMEKAHPNILEQLCLRMGMKPASIKHLHDYITNPKIMTDLMAELGYAKDPVKKMILAVINGGSKDYVAMKAEKSEWMRGFKKEVELIDMMFIAKYPELLEQHKKWRREKNKWAGSDEGSFVNIFLLENEAKMLDAVKRELRKRKLLGKHGDDFVCCADGGMIHRDDRLNDELLRVLEGVIKRDTGFVMKLAFKAMSPRELPEELPMPKKTPEMLKYLEPRIWDEFSRIDVGMPVIACETHIKKLYTNNQRFRISALGDDCVMLEPEIEGRKSDISWGVCKKAFRRDFLPAYCITSHKAQGATFRELHGVHELELMGASGGYVSITRTDDANKVVIFNKKPKNESFLKFLEECAASEAERDISNMVVDNDDDIDEDELAQFNAMCSQPREAPEDIMQYLQ